MKTLLIAKYVLLKLSSYNKGDINEKISTQPLSTLLAIKASNSLKIAFVTFDAMKERLKGRPIKNASGNIVIHI